MKKTLMVAAMFMALGTGSAMAAQGDSLGAGQITFLGQVDPGTCDVSVAQKGQTGVTSDGTVRLQTVTLDDMNTNGSTVQAAAAGLQPTDFAINVDCSKAQDAGLTKVGLYMSSADLADTDGTLENNTNVTLGSTMKMAQGVNIAVHEVDGTTLSLVNMIDHSDAHELTLTDSKGTYNLRASYVKQPDATTITSGAVATYSVYSVVYN
ncbi:pilus assembly protein [Salmonella enterica]|nr:pilus assembly protein [Salmonella enterica]